MPSEIILKHSVNNQALPLIDRSLLQHLGMSLMM